MALQKKAQPAATAQPETTPAAATTQPEAAATAAAAATTQPQPAQAQAQPEPAQATAPAQPEPAQATAPAQPEAAATAAAAAPAQAAVPATRQAAPPPVTSSSVMGEVIFSERKDVFVAEFGTLPRIKASNGNFMDGDNKIMGTWIKFQVLSWNRRWTVTPNDDKAPTTLCRFSLDNVTLDDGSGVTVAQHLADLKTAGYADACSREYYEVVVNLIETERETAHVGGMAQLQLSPTSRKAFDAFRMQTSFKIAQGLLTPAQAEVIKAQSEPVSAGGNNWTKFSFTCVG